MVVGARSAVFAAVPDLGVIVVDEEHDASYKHEADPRYDARRVAAKRARLEGAVTVYGSATPRPEVWHGVAPTAEPARPASAGACRGSTSSTCACDGGYPLTRPLLDALGEIEDGGGRAIVLQNRRGAAAALHCRTCARTWRCGALRRRAHAARPPPALPPLRRVRADAEGVPERAARSTSRRSAPGRRGSRPSFSGASRGSRSSGWTRTWPRRSGSRRRLCAGSARADAAVLVGTQLVAKGHDVPGVKLAAVIDADQALAVPDFRAEERAFALLTQLSGRPGRPGRSARPRDRPGVGPRASPGRAGCPARGGGVPGRRARTPPRARLSALPAAGAACSPRRPSGDVADGRRGGRSGRGGAGAGGRHPARARRRSFGCATGGGATS